ncbi:MAG: HDIG domain-containing protein, partial [Oscillospiraceae bacterium]|nr:HDIG domain-containing protein [Oscillospiraceae bacterium]
MLIVPVENLRAGMVLARDVASTSAREYRTLLMKGTELTQEMIELLTSKGIKTVNIVGAEVAGNAPTRPTEAPANEEQKNAHISRALNELHDIFDSSEEIREFSLDSVKKVDSIADDILADLRNDATTLGNQMIALQNYDDYTYKHCLRVAMLATSICTELKLSADSTKEVIVSALLHDIGKSNIDHDIIIK